MSQKNIFFSAVVLGSSVLTIACSPAQKFSEVAQNTELASSASPEPTPEETAEVLAHLSHVANSRNFTLKTAGFAAGSCLVQVQTNAGFINVGQIACGQNESTVNVAFTANLAQSWNSLPVRLTTLNGDHLAWVTQRLNCVAKVGSATATPNIDEDCNGQWDNAVQSAGAAGGCSDNLGSVPNPGTAYSVPANGFCGANSAQFYQIGFGIGNEDANAYSNADCTGNRYEYMGTTVYLQASSGTVPTKIKTNNNNEFSVTTLACQQFVVPFYTSDGILRRSMKMNKLNFSEAIVTYRTQGATTTKYF